MKLLGADLAISSESEIQMDQKSQRNIVFSNVTKSTTAEAASRWLELHLDVDRVVN